MLTSKLGRDFWLYRLGQFVSSLGDMCSTIALAWWVLNKTGSGKAMAAIMAPAVIVKIMGGLLLGPTGDRLSRKKLVAGGNFLCAIASLCLAAMCYADHFNVAHILAISCLASLGSAIFASGSAALVASIVPSRHYHAAVAQTKLLGSISSILGGVFGGVAVTCVGIGGAFAFDAVSFIVGGSAAVLISQDTVPQQDINAPKMKNAFSQWKKDFYSGVVFLWELKVILYISLMLMAINLLLSPLAIILPIMVKTMQKMPPWYFGVLETSVGAGALIGAGLFSLIAKRASNAATVLSGFLMIGGALLLLSWSAGLAAPVILLGCMGMGMTI
ncbi:MAG: MFS transporter, partial [Elusimicrobiota bacterium]